ncbi:Anaphase-promoting complex subunit 1 [Quaeritorhiza haematococci]|nr:Anaphase-promoting complex subunit 1 [Quaeritorhiza haematococci]
MGIGSVLTTNRGASKTKAGSGAMFGTAMGTGLSAAGDDDDDDDEDWQHLLSSRYHRSQSHNPVLTHLPSPPLSTSLSSPSHTKSHTPTFISTKEEDPHLAALYRTSKSLHLKHHTEPHLLEHLPAILVALHLVYEDLKLDVVREKRGMEEIAGDLLVVLARWVGWVSWVEYYARDGVGGLGVAVHVEDLQKHIRPIHPGLADLSTRVPSIYGWLHESLSSRTNPIHGASVKPFLTLGQLRTQLKMNGRSESVEQQEREHEPDFDDLRLDAGFCERTRKVCAFYDDLRGEASNNSKRTPTAGASSSSTTPCCEENVVMRMVREEFKLKELDCLPFGIALPLREAIRKCKKNPPGGWSPEAYVLVGREDLAEQATGVRAASQYMPPLRRRTSEYDDQPAELTDLHDAAIPSSSAATPKKEEDGTEISNDEISNLRFGKDFRVQEVQGLLQARKPAVVKMSLPPDMSDQDIQVEQQNMLQAVAHRTLALPVGRAAFTFGTATPVLTETFPIPGITVSARLPPLNSVVTLDATNGPPEVVEWPNFHDGVAAGLRISPDCSYLDSSWIVFNKPDEPDSKHAGFLLALGLSGHLRKMVPWHYFNYLTPIHEITSVGLLLGLAVAYRGTMDATVTKLLCVHIPALLPPHSTELNLSSPTQTACILGMGLLYMESLHRRMAEVMLAEIGSSEPFAGAQKDSAAAAEVHRESYSLAAGFALGFITLGKGDEAIGLADMHIVEVLRKYIVGVGHSGDSRKHGKHGKTGGTGAGPGGASGTGASVSGGIGESVNVNVTAPSATVALGLMYLKTNNTSIAAKLAIPNTAYMLDYVRPDFLMLRVISSNLIMWDWVHPTRKWVEGQVPAFIRDVMAKAEGAGGAMGMSAGGAERQGDQEEEEMNRNANVDSVRHAYCNIIAGACYSIGLKFAGSAHEEAFRCLLYYMDYLMAQAVPAATTFAEKLNRTITRSCLDVVATSLGLVMAGTGNIEVLRRLRKLHDRVSQDVVYGNHMACHLALGFLFLSGGTCTFNTSNRSIAALYCALFPKYPTSMGDNRSHLQAFRHLWVLATDNRCLVARDVDTREASCVKISLTVDRIMAPASGCGGGGSSTDETTELQMDPRGQRSILARSFPKNFSVSNVSGEHKERSREEFIKSFSADPHVLAFANHLCRASPCQPASTAMASFCTSVLYECLTMDKPEIIETYLSIYQAVQNLSSQQNTMAIWNIKLVMAFYQYATMNGMVAVQCPDSSLPSRAEREEEDQPLIQEQFMLSVKYQLESFFERLCDNGRSDDQNGGRGGPPLSGSKGEMGSGKRTNEVTPMAIEDNGSGENAHTASVISGRQTGRDPFVHALQQYFAGGEMPMHNPTLMVLLGSYLILHDAPQPDVMGSIRETLSSFSALKTATVPGLEGVLKDLGIWVDPVLVSLCEKYPMVPMKMLQNIVKYSKRTM